MDDLDALLRPPPSAGDDLDALMRPPSGGGDDLDALMRPPGDSRTPTRGVNRRGRRSELTHEQRVLRQRRLEQERAQREGYRPAPRLSDRAQDFAATTETGHVERGMHPDLIAAAMSGNAEQSAGGLLQFAGEAVGGGMGALLGLGQAGQNPYAEAMRRSGAQVALDAGAEAPDVGDTRSASVIAAERGMDVLGAAGRDMAASGAARTRHARQGLLQSPEDFFSLSAVPYTIQEGLISTPNLAASAGAAALTGGSLPAGLAVAGLMAGGSEFAEQRAAGESFGQSALDAAVAGTGEAIGEVLPLGVVFNRLGRFMPNGAVKRLVDSPGGKLLATGLAEGAGETVTEGWNMAYEAAVKGEDIELSDALLRMRDAFGAGFFAGAGVGTPNYLQDRARDRSLMDIDPAINEGLGRLAEDSARRAFDVSRATARILATPAPASVEGVEIAATAFEAARAARRAEVRQPLPTAGAAIAPALPEGTQLRSTGRMRQEIPVWGSRQPQQAETPLSPPAIQPSAMPEGRLLAEMTADEQRAELDQRLADRGISMRAQQDAAEEGARPTVDFYREPDEQIARSSSGMIDFNWDAEEADAPAPVRTGPEPPEFSPTGRRYGQAPDDALPDWAPPEGRRLDVRRAEAGELADAFLGIAGAGQAAFQLPQVPEEARTIEDIASAVDPQVRIARGRVESVRGKYPNAREVYSITMRDGTSARFVVEEDGGTQLNASALEEGKSGGAALYAIVNTFAQRNGLKALPDREGLSEINKTRRTEQQAASALRTGSTQHLATDITQRVAGFERDGEDRANTGALLMKGYANTVSALPEIHQLRYNFDSGQFEWTNGEIADDADFDRLAASDPAREIGAGRSTVKRAVLAASILREVRRRGVGSGKVLGDAGRQQLQQLAAPALERIFYARDGVADGADAPSLYSENADRGGHPASAEKPPAGRGGASAGRAAPQAAPRNPARTAATVWGELASGLGQRMARRLRAQPWLFVLNNRAELRTNKDLARWASQLSPSEMVGGFYTPSGDVILIADEMVEFDADGRPVDVAATAIALHEIGVHYGLKGLLGGDFQRVLEEFAGLEATDPKVAAAFARIPRDTPQNQRREEALAYYIQQNFDQPVALMDRIMAAITRFLRRFGSDRQYTPDQLRALVRGATEKASRGQLRERFAERNDTAEAREAEALAFSSSETASGFTFKTARDGRMRVSGDLARARELIKGANIPVKGTVRTGPEGAYLDVSPTYSDAVRAALSGRESTASRAGAVYDHPKDREGKYVGAPPRFNTARTIGRLRAQLKALALEGESGRFWYEESSEAILDFTGGNVDDADLMAKLLAIYSPQARVDSNTTLALRAYYQIKAGVPVSVKTEVQDVKAQAAADGAPLREWMGEKTNNFYLNLMTRIAPDRVRELQGATIDMWMMRAFQYPTDAPSATQYRFAEIETNRLARELGWEPQQVQAAIWVAMKARTENPGVKKQTEAASIAAGDMKYVGNTRVFAGKDAETRHAMRWAEYALAHTPTAEDAQQAGFHFGDGLRANGGQLSWEATPSKDVSLLSWVHSNMEAKNALQARMADAIGDRILREFDVLAEAAVFGYGGWQGAVSPSSQEQLAIASQYRAVEGKKTEKPGAHPVSAERISAVARVYGLLLKQDGVAWHRPFYSDTQAASNGVHLDFGRPLTPDETQELYDLVTSAIMAKGVAEDVARQVAPIPHETGVRFLNFGQLEKNPDLFKIAFAAAEKLSVDANFTALRFRSDGDLVENNWKEDRNGEGYRRRILDAGFGDQLGRLEAELGPAIEDVFRGIERDFGPERVSFSRAGRDVGRPAAAGDRLGPAQQAELTRPSFSARKPQKDAVAAVGVHYSPVAGLTSLDPTFAGTAFAGGERRRFGPGRFGRDNPRLNFYVQDGDAQPGKERALAGAQNGYTVTLENLYDYAEDPRGIVAENYPNQDAIEEEVADAGFDGMLLPPVAGIPNRTAIVFGFKKKVPVAPVEDAGFFGDERISKSSSAAEQPRDELGRFAPTGTPPVPRPKPDKRFSTSTKNEYTNEERELLAKDPVFSALPSRAHEDLVLDALAKLKRNPRAAEDVAAELAAGLIDTVSEEQEALLLVGKIQLMRERAKVAQRAFDRRYTESNRAGAMQEWDEVESRITQLDIANRTTGAIWARTGHLRQRVLREDFSFDTMAERLARSLGRPLTVEEGREIDQMSKAIRQRDLALAAAEERAREAEDLADSQRMLVEMVEQTAAFLTSEVKARSRPLLALVRKMAAESRAALARMDERKVGVNRPSQRKQGGAVDIPRIFHITRIGMAELVEMGYRGADWTQAKTHAWRVRMRKALGPRRFRYNEDIMPGILKQARADLDKINATAEERVRASVENAAEYGLTHADVYELVEALVASGMTDETAVMAEATRRLQEVQPGITLRDVRRLFTDYGRARFPSTDAVKKRTRELRELQRLQESIDRLEEGMPALKTGQQRDKASATVRERRRRLNELLRIEELKGAADPVRLATFQDARISNLRNLIADLKRMLETGERPISIPAPPPTDEAKQLMQEVSDLRKQIREVDQAGGSRAKERALKQMRDREAMLARRLEALQQQVLKGERAPARTKTSGAKSPIELQIANLEAQLRAIERAKKPQLSRAEKVNKARLRALEREERTLTEELLTGLRRPPGSPVAPTAEVEVKAAAVRALREQARELRAASMTPEQAEQNYQLGVSKLLAREIRRIEARMAAGDFTKKPRAAKRMLSAENLQTQLELRKLKHAFAKRVFDAEMAKRTRIQKGFGLVVETFNATRSIMTSIDWSAILRQSLFTFGHPVLAAKVFKPMFLATFSEAQNVNIEEQIRKRPNYQLYERAKLHLTESHGYDPKRVEEQFVGRWLERIEEVDGEAGKNLARKVHRWATAPVRGSGRAYSTFTNLMRVEMFDMLYGSLVNDPTAPAQAELEAIANLVNVFTGRGTFGKTVDAGGVAASMLLFAPRYLASRFNVLLGQPILRGYLASEPGTNKRIARMAAKEYARTLVGMAAIYGLAAMWQAVNGDDDDEEPIATLDPRSSDFGKIKFGNVYLDPMAGLAQATVFMARVWTKETMVDGEVRSLGPDRDFGQRSVYDVMADFGRSKLSPMAGFIVNSLTDEGFGGEPLTNIEAAQELAAPLAWREVPGVVKDQGLPEGMALMTLSWLGMGIQYRDPDRWDEIKEKRADYREERGR